MDYIDFAVDPIFVKTVYFTVKKEIKMIIQSCI